MWKHTHIHTIHRWMNDIHWIHNKCKLTGGRRRTQHQFDFFILSLLLQRTRYGTKLHINLFGQLFIIVFNKVFPIEFTTQNTNSSVVRTSNYARETQSLLTSILFFFCFFFSTYARIHINMYNVHTDTHVHTHSVWLVEGLKAQSACYVLVVRCVEWSWLRTMCELLSFHTVYVVQCIATVEWKRPNYKNESIDLHHSGPSN